ncbi:MAG TPA: hypothetical protein VEZ72_22330 [Paenibacillus sp.]|nr:hypothetical protein [Paenibacillus sp.]
MDEFKLKTKWFGLNRSDVSRHFRTSKRLQDLELEELKAEIARLERENQALRMAVDALPPVAKRVAEQTPLVPVAEPISLPSSAADEPAAEAPIEGEATVLEVEVPIGGEATILEAEVPIEGEATILEAEMPVEGEATTLEAEAEVPIEAEPTVLEAEELPVPEAAPSVAEDTAEASPIAAIVPLDVANEESVAPAVAVGEPDPAVSSAPRNSNVVEFRRRVAEEPAQPPVPQEPAKPEAAEVEPARKLAAAASMGFWGSANDVMEQVWAEAPTTIAFDEISAAAAPYAPAPAEPKRRKEEPREAPKEAPKAPLRTEALPRAEAPAASPAPAPRSAESGPSSPAISEEIRSLRTKYIVGKCAGEDLFDASGKRIVSKGAVIDEDVVEAADRAGKLAELIVHMIIPGLGD